MPQGKVKMTMESSWARNLPSRITRTLPGQATTRLKMKCAIFSLTSSVSQTRILFTAKATILLWQYLMEWLAAMSQKTKNRAKCRRLSSIATLSSKWMNRISRPSFFPEWLTLCASRWEGNGAMTEGRKTITLSFRSRQTSARLSIWVWEVANRTSN